MDYSTYKTDKIRNHSYMPVYERIFAHLRNKKISLLEIGVFSGGCLCLWRDFFKKGSSIEGLDIHCASLAKNDLGDIVVHDTDIMDWDTEKVYDVIIDDASHDAGEQALTLMKLWKNISSRGIYVIEDVNRRFYDENMRGGIDDHGILDFCDQNQIDMEVHWGEEPYQSSGSGDTMFIFRHKATTPLTIFQKIVNMFRPRKNKGDNIYEK